MGELARFDGLIIFMYPFDNLQHHIPHIHVWYGGKDIVVSIIDGTILKGNLNSSQRNKLYQWMLKNKFSLLQEWENAICGNKINKVGE
jgi:hypothetical protein